MSGGGSRVNILPGITLQCSDDLIALTSDQPLRCLSSAMIEGGVADTQHVLIRHVDKSYACRDAQAEYQAFACERGIAGPFVGLMTAVWLHQMAVAKVAEEGLTGVAIVTAGTRNATAVGRSLPFTRCAPPGTINIVMLLDAQLTPAALVNAVITTTEAKVDVLRERGILTREGFQATGTSTDAVAVACTQSGAALPYAGPATPVGYLIGRCVRQGLEEALNAYFS